MPNEPSGSAFAPVSVKHRRFDASLVGSPLFQPDGIVMDSDGVKCLSSAWFCAVPRIGPGQKAEAISRNIPFVATRRVGCRRAGANVRHHLRPLAVSSAAVYG